MNAAKGEIWWIKLPGDPECKIYRVSSSTDNLYFLSEKVWEYNPPTYGFRWSVERAYKRCDVEFVEQAK